jgi:hypothetical protein
MNRSNARLTKGRAFDLLIALQAGLICCGASPRALSYDRDLLGLPELAHCLTALEQRLKGASCFNAAVSEDDDLVGAAQNGRA